LPLASEPITVQAEGSTMPCQVLEIVISVGEA